MATIKSYTDVNQSRKLAEILPLESADMYWSRCTITDFGDNILKVSYSVEPCNFSQFKNTDADISCWSLAALLSVLPEIQGSKPVIALDDNYITYPHMSDLHTKADNLVDACYEMILKLKESNLL